MDPDDDIPEDKILETPEQAMPGDLSRLWAIHSNVLHQQEVDELNAELAGDAPPRMIFAWTSPYEKRRIEEKRRREQREYEQAMLEITERQEQLLLHISEEQAEIDRRRKEIEDNALRLRDGRRVYVDGDRFRDGEGRVLTGADESEAARQHEYRPDASTWAQKQDIDRQADENQKLKDKVLKDRESGQGAPQDEAQKLDGYEKEFAEKVEARQEAMGASATEGNTQAASQRLDGYEKEFADKVLARTEQPVPDYGGADYMAEYQLSAVPAFTAAASNVSPEAIRKLSDDDSGTQTAEIKKPQGPFGQGPTFKP